MNDPPPFMLHLHILRGGDRIWKQYLYRGKTGQFVVMQVMRGFIFETRVSKFFSVASKPYKAPFLHHAKTVIRMNKYIDACWLATAWICALWLAGLLQGIIWLRTSWLCCLKRKSDLSQKWVSGGINIHYTPNDAISGNIRLLTVHSSSEEPLQCTYKACMALRYTISQNVLTSV